MNAKTEARKESQFHLSSHSHRQTRGGEIYLRKCELNSTLGKKKYFARLLRDRNFTSHFCRSRWLIAKKENGKEKTGAIFFPLLIITDCIFALPSVHVSNSYNMHAK